MIKKIVSTGVMISTMFMFIGCGGSSSSESPVEEVVEVVEPSPTAEKLSDSTIVYNASPQLNNELNITIEINDDKKIADSYIWSIVSQPDGASLELTSFSDGKSVIFTPLVAGKYILKVLDANKDFKETEFFISKEFIVDISKIDSYDGSQNLSKIEGLVKNQIWVNSESLNRSEIESIVAKYSVFTVIDFDDILGLLVQFDETGNNIYEEIEKLKLESGIDSLNYRYYEGSDTFKQDEKIADDGSAFNDLGDNWHLEYIDIDKAWDTTTGSKDFLIGITDGIGKYYNKHEDLKGRFSDVIAISTKDINTCKTEKWYDDLSTCERIGQHGTAVSGAIGAISNNKKGMSGINWTTKLVGKKGGYDGLKSIISTKKVLLSSNSWATAGYLAKDFDPTDVKKVKARDDTVLAKTRKYLDLVKNEKYKNKLFVWSAGNGVGNGASTSGFYGVDGRHHSPALHYNSNGILDKQKNVLFVAAILNDNRLVYYSNFGKSVDIAAPTKYKSTKSNNATSNNYYDGKIYGENVSGGFGGTSASAPVVTGVASLIFSLNKDFIASDVKSILINSATKTVKERYIKSGSIGENNSNIEKLDHEIPILDAGSALKLAKDIIDGKIAKFTYGLSHPFNAEAIIRITSANGKLDTKKVSFNLEGSADTISWTSLGTKSNDSSDVSVLLNDKYLYYRLTGSVDLEHTSTGIVAKPTFNEEFTLSNIVAIAKDTTTLEAVTGVSIEVQPMFMHVSGLPAPEGSGSVGEDGKVRLYLTKGSYKIIANKVGYKEFRKIINITDSPTSTAVDILMTSDSVDLVGTIGGIVVSDNGEPIKNALIRLSGGEQTNGFFASAVTDDLGVYNLSNINKKDSNGNLITSFTLSASAKGYSEVIKEDIVVLSASSVNYNFTLLAKDISETIIYATSFEDSTSNWTSTGLWHIQDLKTTSIVNTLVDNGFVSLSPDEEADHAYLPNADDGNNALWYGLADTGSFISTQQDGDSLNSGGTSTSSHNGTITSPLIDLTGTTQPILSFRTWWEIEAVNPNENGYDIMDIKIAVDGGEFTTIKRLNPHVDPSIENREDKAFSSAGVIRKPIWVLEELDLSEYAGKNINIQFYFDTKDGLFNGFRGWFIDTLSIIEGTENNVQSSKMSKIINTNTQKRTIFDGLSEEYIRVHKKPLKYINSEKKTR